MGMDIFLTLGEVLITLFLLSSYIVLRFQYHFGTERFRILKQCLSSLSLDFAHLFIHLLIRILGQQSSGICSIPNILVSVSTSTLYFFNSQKLLGDRTGSWQKRANYTCPKLRGDFHPVMKRSTQDKGIGPREDSLCNLQEGSSFYCAKKTIVLKGGSTLEVTTCLS